LPSEVLKSGNSIDIQCADLAAQYEAFIHKKASNKADGKDSVSITPQLSVDEMKAMIDRVNTKGARNEVKT
jgi:hypothetical protein